MLRYFKCFLFALIALFVFSYSVFANPATIEDLINNSQRYDGKKVLLEAEAIGHLMKRGDFAWFNINDGTGSIGVWISSELTEKIEHLGKHAVIGDLVRVDGIFNARCPMHGGDTDIHAESMIIAKKGKEIELTYNPTKVNILALLAGLMICLYIIKILKKQR